MKSLTIPLTQQQEMERLLTLLGGPENLSILEESEFLEQTGCPPQELEPWLGDAWVQCDIRAVLAGKEEVGPQPVLLVHQDENQVAVRLFYPTKRLLLENVRAEGLAHMRAVIAARPWAEAAEEIISQVDALTLACAARELPTIEIKLFWKALWTAIYAFLQLRSGPQATQMRRLVASLQALDEACQQRGADQSPQGKYSEARLNSRRSLGKSHNPVLDGFPELVEIAVEHSSREVAEYVLEEVDLSCDQYLDAMQMMARDRCNPAEVANPPARVRSALTRQQRRRDQLERERGLPLTDEQTNGLEHPEQTEARVIAKIDWELGKAAVGLPTDQSRAVEAEMDGLNLQAPEAPNELEWEAERLARVRRSLEPDRRWGRKLRRHLAAYTKE